MRLANLQDRLLSQQDLWTRMVQDLPLDAATRTLREGGPSAAWLLGHMLRSTNEVTRALAGAPPDDPPGVAQETPHAGVETAADLDRLRAAWDEAARALRRALSALQESDLDLAPAVPLHPDFEDELATREAFLEGHLFHLTWHAGQVGMLRAASGLGWA